MNIPGAVAGRALARRRERPTASLPKGFSSRSSLSYYFLHLLSNASTCPYVDWTLGIHHPLIVFTRPRFPGKCTACLLISLSIWLFLFGYDFF